VLRGTHGSGLLTHFPLDPSSTYGKITGCLAKAYDRVCERLGSDPNLDRGGRAPDAPLQWANHSNRRYADTRSRDTMDETGATPMDIDLTFGWKEADYKKEMQVHYEVRFTREKRTAVTSLL
jgi:hypothetical protein